MPLPYSGMSVYAALCQFFYEKWHDFGYATSVLLKNKLNSPYVSYISFIGQPQPPPHPPPPPLTYTAHTHTHTHNFTEDFRCQEYCGPNTFGGGGGGGGIYLRCTSEISVLMIFELVRYWLYYNFAFSRMRLSGKQFTSKPWISKQLPTPYAL